MKHWASDLIGIPYLDGGRTRTGMDCWGPPIIVWKEQKGIELPDFVYESSSDSLEIEQIILSQIGFFTRVNSPQEFDLAAFRIPVGGPLCHVGIMVDKERFLHAHKGINSCIESAFTQPWSRRLDGFYRPK